MPEASTLMLDPLSTCVPPRKVEYVSALPVAFSLVTNMSICPAIVRLNAPAVVGKSFEYTSPVTNALPAPSTAIARGESMSVPPRKVEYVSAEPAALSLNTNPSVTSVAQRGQFGGMLMLRSNALPVTGKFDDFVVPVTYALPEASIAMPLPKSRLLPPTNVE